jgi:hypothetical protein
VVNCGKLLQRAFIDVRFVALANGADVGLKAEPLEVFEQRAFVFRTASEPIVVFTAEEHSTAERSGDAPDMHGMHHVAKVQVPCRGRGEARQRARRQPLPERLEVHVHDASC